MQKKKCENEDNINGAGRGGVVDEGENVMNDRDEKIKFEKFQQEALTKHKYLIFFMRRSTLELQKSIKSM